MYNAGLKQAAKASLRDTDSNPKQVLLLYLAVLFVLDLGYSLTSTFLEQAVAGSKGGFGALGLLKSYNVWYNVAPILILLVNLVWNAGYTAYALHVSRGQSAGPGDLTTGFRLLGKVLWLFIREFVFIYLWSMLLVIPGLVAAYRYRMAIYALLEDPSISAGEAMEISKRITYGHKLELLVLDLSFWWYYLLLGLAMGVSTYGNLTLEDLWTGFGVYLGAEALTLVVNWLFFGYVQTTYAHAYNYLRQLSDQRYMGWQAEQL